MQDLTFLFMTGLSDCKDSEQRFRIISRARFHSVAHAILARFGHLTGKSGTAVAEDSSGEMKESRVLGVTCLVGQAVLCGALASQHIETQEATPAARKNVRDEFHFRFSFYQRVHEPR